MNELLKQLLDVLPIIASITDNKVDDMVAQLVQRGEQEISRRMAAKGQTRAEVLADGTKTWDVTLVQKIDWLKNLNRDLPGKVGEQE